VALLVGRPAQALDDPYPTQVVETDRGSVAYWDTGAGEMTVMLVHGLPTSKELWVDVVPLLAGNCRVIVPDLPDFGDARDAHPDTLVHDDRATALEQLRIALGLEHFVLVAHDLGSSVAVCYMGLYGEHVDRLILMSSPVYPDFEEPHVVDLLRNRLVAAPLLNLLPRTLMRRTMHLGLVHDEAWDRYQKRSFIDHYRWPRGKRRLYRSLAWGTPEEMFAGYPDILKQLTVPTLLLQGTEDPWIPREHAHRLHRDVPGASLVLLEGGAHFIPLDLPERVADEIIGFVEGPVVIP